MTDSDQVDPAARREPLRPGTVLAWIVIIACVALVATLRGPGAEPEPLTTPAPVPAAASADEERQFRIIARYVVGASAVLGEHAPRESLLAQATTAATTPADRLRLVPVTAEIVGADEALKQLEAIELAEDPGHTALAEALRRNYTSSPDALDADQRATIAAMGWFGQLALSWQRPPDDPVRQQALAPARQAFFAIIGVIIIGPIALATGAGLLILGIVWWGRGRLRVAFMPPVVGGWLIEAFAIYLAWFILASVMRGLVGGTVIFGSLAAAAPLACLWPLVRGMSGRDLRSALGWHTGRGVIREVAAGIVGYVAGLPILLGGFLITFILVRFTGIQPTHPVVEGFSTEFWHLLMVFSLAVVYAPLAEELMFRGAFYGGMRRSWGVLLSVLVTSFIFAAIHPQGWVGVPVLMSIAVIFAMLREWRGSLIAPVVGHAINNGGVLVLLILVAG